MEIEEKLSETVYRVRHCHTGRSYIRSVVNVSRWQGSEESKVAEEPSETTDPELDSIQIGDVVAVVDEKGDTLYSLARVRDIVDNNMNWTGPSPFEPKGIKISFLVKEVCVYLQLTWHNYFDINRKF